jgi:arsenate reductase (glutaredoxin)
MIQIYHNNRCSKSRCALQYLEESKQQFEVVNYLQIAPSTAEIEDLLLKLKLEPLDIVRKNEFIFKEQFKNKTLTRSEWIQVLHENPILIERPIIVGKNSAVIARPPELTLDFLKNNS